MRRDERVVAAPGEDAVTRGWLLRLLRQEPRALDPELGDLTPPAWKRLLAEAARHNVMPLVHRRLANAAAPVPEEVRSELRRFAAENTATILAQLRELPSILRALEDENIPAVLLKGAYLAHAVYESISLRPMCDIDLLVKPADAHRAEEVLVGLGYRSMAGHFPGVDYARLHHLAPLHKDCSAVEIHHHIVPPGNPLSVDLNGLWSRVRTVEIAGAKAYALSPEDLVLHLSVHAAYNHRFAVTVRTLCDLDAVLRRETVDWEKLATIAQDAAASRFVACTLAVAEDLLMVPLPAAARSRFGRQDLDRELLESIGDFIMTPAPELPTAYKHAGEAKGVAAKARIVARSLFPTPERLRRIYGLPPGSRWVVFYYLLRPVDLLVRRSGMMARIAAGSPATRPAVDWERRRRRIRRWMGAGEAGPPA
jgi:hypothetical protein